MDRSNSRFQGPQSIPKYPNRSQSEVISDEFRRSIENCSKKYFRSLFIATIYLVLRILSFSVSYDEKSSPNEGRSPHYKLTLGILVGIFPLTLLILVYIKKRRR